MLDMIYIGIEKFYTNFNLNINKRFTLIDSIRMQAPAKEEKPVKPVKFTIKDR